jgi:hypothetical protein
MAFGQDMRVSRSEYHSSPPATIEPSGIWIAPHQLHPRQPVLHEGYRIFRDPNERRGGYTYRIAAITTREKVMSLLAETVDRFGEDTGILIYDAHHIAEQDGHPCMQGSRIQRRLPSQLPIMQSHLGEYPDLLFDDGFFALCLLNTVTDNNVLLDFDKTLVATAFFEPDLRPVKDALHAHGIYYNEAMNFPQDLEHQHNLLVGGRDRLVRFLEEIGDPVNPVDEEGDELL